MAQPTNTFDTYDNSTAIKEDIANIVYKISPEETPFYSKCKKMATTSTNAEWLTEELRAAASNAHIEGDDSVGTARTAASRLGNYTQIFKDVAIIPDTVGGNDAVAAKGTMAKEILKAAAEQKRDIELALFANNAKVAGNSTTARELAGMPTWLITNTDFGANEGADATGLGADARTDETTTLIAFSQARFDGVMESIWNEGGRADTCYLSSANMNLALGFTGNNNQRNTVKSGDVSKVMDVYMTPWGSITFIPSRHNRTRDVFLCQSDMWKIRTKRATKQTPLAKTGDAEKRQIVTELTLEASNEASSGGVFDNS